ncbi:MAG: cytochrome c3 family protein, partial [Deltaproteobacteria bacterium]|nr:cytochrome c3 family protein [Deltaproteobacteria bacterium]
MKIPANFQKRVTCIMALFLIAIVGFKGEPAAQQQPVAEEQQAAELQSSKQPGSKTSMMDEFSCETCHGTLKEVAANTTRFYPTGAETNAAKEASKDEAFAINPHESHYGEMECTQCHKNGETTLYCNTCHSFQMEPRNAMVEVSD